MKSSFGFCTVPPQICGQFNQVFCSSAGARVCCYFFTSQDQFFRSTFLSASPSPVIRVDALLSLCFSVMSSGTLSMRSVTWSMSCGLTRSSRLTGGNAHTLLRLCSCTSCSILTPVSVTCFDKTECDESSVQDRF